MTQAEFFQRCATDKEFSKKKCEVLQELPADTVEAWEKTTSSPDFSPGPVAEAETLLRQVIQDQHWDAAKQQLKPNVVDDARDKGMSVDREGVNGTTRQSCAERGRARVQKLIEAKPELRDKKKFIGLSALQVSDVRAIKAPNGRRGYCIYDTADEESKAHADICLVIGKQNDGDLHRRSVRSKLFELAQSGLETNV